MELWIRSQDRKKLIKVDEVKIETVKEGNTFIYSHATDLGTYETKERALEVLDEIQNMLYISISFTNEPYHNADIRVKTEMLCNMVKVYQMPKE